MKRSLFISILTLQLFSFCYLVWWDGVEIHSGLFAPIILIDWLAGIFVLVLGTTCIIGGFCLYKKWKYCTLFGFPLITLLFLLKVQHGYKTATFVGGAESEIFELNTYSDGHYYLVSINQTYELREDGTYFYEADTLILIDSNSLTPIFNSDKLTNKQVNSCYTVQTVGFKSEISSVCINQNQ